jgi:hypothetical protein
MIRDRFRDQEYFDRGIAFKQAAIDEDRSTLAAIALPDRQAGCATDMWTYSTKLVIQRYSRGDPPGDLQVSVEQMLDLLALRQATLANPRLDEKDRAMYGRLDLATLYESLTFLAFLVALRAPATDLRRAVELIRHPGEDAVLDHVASACGASRTPAAQCKFPRVYAGLAEVIVASPDQRAAKLRKFVESWYKRISPIYWHDNHRAAEGAYFGYWCFEAALVAMVFDIDDRELLNHAHYPGDLTQHYRAT